MNPLQLAKTPPRTVSKLKTVSAKLTSELGNWNAKYVLPVLVSCANRMHHTCLINTNAANNTLRFTSTNTTPYRHLPCMLYTVNDATNEHATESCVLVATI